MIKLDLLDKKLLYELDLDARQSFAQLSRKIKASQEVVRYRLKRLIDNKIIEDFMTIIDIGRLGFYHYEVYFRFQKLNEQKENELIKFIINSNNVLWFSSCTGHYDLVFSVMAKNNIHFSEILSKITNKYGEFIAERNIQSTIKIPHFTRAYLLPNKDVQEVSFSSASPHIIKIDQIDFKILRTIMNNGRMPLIEIAHKLKLKEDTVKYRLKNLRKKGVIQTFRPRLNKKNMGYLLYQILFSFKNLNDSLKKSFIEYCKSIGNVVYVLDTIGKYDFIVEVEPENQEHFNDLLKKIRNKYSNKIINYETISITKEHKMDYFRIDKKEYFNNSKII
ncbi:AsnC family transcriptional regulator [Candidatus Pacearchaeota archaeon]|nr:AsnC family transcriptional regulator [Candidatus Pacearchaeota archaeon]